MAVPLLLSSTKRLSRRALLPRNYATRVEPPNFAITSGALGGTTHLRHFNRVAFSRCRVVIPLFYCLFNGVGIVDTDQSGTIQIACSLEYPFNSGTRYSFLFSGVRNPSTTAAAAQGYLISDWLELGFTIPANVAFGSFTFQAVASGVTPYGNVFTGGASYNEGVSYSATPTDSTVNGAIADNFNFGLGPMLILTEGILPSVALWGDSIPNGSNGFSQGNSNGNMGWAAMYSYRLGYGYSKYTAPGEAMLNANTTNWKRRLPLFALANPTHVISTYGTNDIGNGLTTTFSGLQNSKANEVNLYRQYRPNIPVLAATLLPRTTSTDSWVTTANQSAQSNFGPLGSGLREQYNGWLRTRPAGLSGVLDIAAFAETAVNSNLWVVNGSANYATTDGTHPTQAIHNIIANGLPTGRIL